MFFKGTSITGGLENPEKTGHKGGGVYMEFGRHEKKKIYIGIIICIVYFAFNNRVVYMETAFMYVLY